MNLTLTRKPSDGMSVRGTLSPLGMATLENQQYLIPCGTYRIAVTYSPRFKRPLPLVCDVPYAGSGLLTPPPLRGSGGLRSGIRFHPGTKPEHSRGCILISRSDEDRLCDFITSHAPVTLKIING